VKKHETKWSNHENQHNYSHGACRHGGRSNLSGAEFKRAQDAQSGLVEAVYRLVHRREHKASESLCSHTLKSVASTVTAYTLTAYISSRSSGSGLFMSHPTSQAGLTAAASITQALPTG
tara:strand:- start:777 stop:1133 length:357 start_codon:yes stop_codon:yes gene_type:complete